MAFKILSLQDKRFTENKLYKIMILKKKYRKVNCVFSIKMLLVIMILFSCESKKTETYVGKNKIIGSIDSLSINKRMHDQITYDSPSFIYYVTIYNIDTSDYKIYIPSVDGFGWRWKDSPNPYLWLFPEQIDTCYEAVIFDYLGIADTIITIKDKRTLTINPYRCSRTIPEVYNMYEINSDYENIIWGDFYLKMLNLYNGDTIIFNKSNHFKVKYKCDGIEFSPLDSVKMNERIIIGGVIYPPGDVLSNKANTTIILPNN